MPRSVSRQRRAVCIRAGLAASSTLLAVVPFSVAAISITQNSSTKWTIGNGDLTVTFDPVTNNLTTLAIGSGSNLLDPNNSQIYPEFAGTPFGAGTETSGYQQTSNYIDFWTTTASTGTSTNPITYSFHYVMFNNDPDIVCYEVLNHSATDPATGVGQGQFIARFNTSMFNQSYQYNVSVNNLGAQTSTIPPTYPADGSPNASTVDAVTGRDVTNATYDLTGSGLAGDWGMDFNTKYDYASYFQLLQADTTYGSQYAESNIYTSLDSVNGGPTHQDLMSTNLALIGFLSGHLGDANESYVPQQGVSTSRLFGPFAFRFTATDGESGAQLYSDAVASMPTLQSDYNTDNELISNGYIPTTTSARGSIQVNATSTAGWSSNVDYNTVVFSDPNKMFQESNSGYQYWGQLSTSGATSISNVVPGTYRMTIYQLGQWGETRTDGVQVAAGQTTTPTAPQFIPENFSTAGNSPIWTIGTPDRSSHEFLNGSNDSYTYSNGNVTGTPVTNNGVTPGGDFREYYGNYNYWQEEVNLGHNGYVSYYATAVGSTPATNNPLDWIANQWGKFDPGIYDPVNDTTDGYTNTNSYVPPNGTQPAYVAASGGAATYGGAPWQVNFTTTAAQSAQGQYVVLSVGLAGNEGSLTISLNGHSETWHYGATTSDPMVRSGVAGTYEMLVYQWPVSDLNAAGTQDQFTFSVSQTDGVMYDALRMEITNTAATPNTTGWHDYAYITGSNTQTNPDNVLPTDPPTWNLNGGGTWATSGNWLFGVPNAAGATAFLASGPGITASSTITLNANETLGALILNNTVGGSSNSYTIAQSGGVGSLIFDNGSAQALIDDEAGSHLIGVPITLDSDLSASVATAGTTLTISNVISGTGRLLVSGAGAVMLSGNNTYSGDTAVNSGTLNLASAGHIVSTNILVASGATFLDAGTISTSTNLIDNGTTSITAAAPTVATLTGSGTLNLNPTILTVSGGGTLSGVVAGTGGITVSGGALKLSAANTYTGVTSVTGGSLELASPGALATSSISVFSGATVTLDSGTTISSTPSFTDTGTATFNNTADSVAALNGAGTLNLTPTALTVTNGGSFSGLIASSGSLTVSGGALILSHADTFSGAMAVTGGSLEVASPGSIASTTVSTSSGATLTVDSGASIPSTTNLIDNGTASFKNTAQSIATLNGRGTLNLNPTALTIGSGGTFSGPINGTGSLTLSGGILTLRGSLGTLAVTDAATTTLNINGSASASPTLVSNGLTNFAANTGVVGPVPVALASMTIGAAGAVTVNSSPLHANCSVVEVGSLTFANTPAAPQGLFNLKDNDLIVHNGNLSNIISEIAAASDEGQWNGTGGITSSLAAAAGNTMLAAVLNDDETGTHTALYSTFDGQPVIDSDVLVKYTFFGDANFDGVVNAADYLAIDNGFDSQTSSDPLTGWQNGDFNADGKINGDDYTLIDNAYNSQGSVSYAADSAGPADMIATDTVQIATTSSTAVPEPTSLTLASVLTCGLLARRRR